MCNCVSLLLGSRDYRGRRNNENIKVGKKTMNDIECHIRFRCLHAFENPRSIDQLNRQYRFYLFLKIDASLFLFVEQMMGKCWG